MSPASPQSGPTPEPAGQPGQPAPPAPPAAPAPRVALPLALGALGVVFGDIGTSPLYALQTVFSSDNHAVRPVPGDVYGIISLVFWSILIVVSVKYVAFMLRADNDGEGGIMALAALIRQRVAARRVVAIAVLLGMVGAALFFGDSVITPAISVLSAVEGINVVSPAVQNAVLPIGAGILVVLFVAQRFGTQQVGRLFGPVMLLWFTTIAVLGVPQIVGHPGIARSLSPGYAFSFAAADPRTAFLAMGAVVLAITGAEALYADMGHFGKPPIRQAWFAVVFPALTLNYLGQGALILHDRTAVANPFFYLVPGWGRIPMVVLATLATVIASQAVISGAFSVTRQAMRLGFVPHLEIRQTSREHGGQIYLPTINWLVFAGVLVIMFAFRSSSRLASAYGLAVTGTLLLTTALFLVLAHGVWHWRPWKLLLAGVVFGGLELIFFAANLIKVPHGGWLPLLIGVLTVTVMLTWQRGVQVVSRKRTALEGPLRGFVDEMQRRRPSRVPGTAVFPHPTKDTVPLALRANVRFNEVLHERVVIVSVRSENVPYVPLDQSIEVDSLDYATDGIVHLSARFGFMDEQDIPKALAAAYLLTPELDIDPDAAFYFLSRITIEGGPHHDMPKWQQRIFIALARNSGSAAADFCLPAERTLSVSTVIEI